MTKKLRTTLRGTSGGRVDSMQTPLMLRSTHLSLMRIMKANLDSRESAIAAIRQLLAQRDEQIASLTKLLAEPKCNDYTSDKSKKEEKPKEKNPVMFPGRPGWRTRAQMLSDATLPKPNDSARALEEKVIKEGGTV